MHALSHLSSHHLWRRQHSVLHFHSVESDSRERIHVRERRVIASLPFALFSMRLHASFILSWSLWTISALPCNLSLRVCMERRGGGIKRERENKRRSEYILENERSRIMTWKIFHFHHARIISGYLFSYRMCFERTIISKII